MTNRLNGLATLCTLSQRVHNKRFGGSPPQNQTSTLRPVQTLPEDNSCPYCKKIFTTSKVLKRHIRSHLGQFLHTCPTCGKGFQLKKYLVQHCVVHSGPKFQCHICPKALFRKESFDAHIKRHTTISDEPNFPCPSCKKGFCSSERPGLPKYGDYLRGKTGSFSRKSQTSN